MWGELWSASREYFVNQKNLGTYIRVPPKHGPSYHDIAYTIALIAAENIADVELKLYTPYLFLWGELWVPLVNIL